MGRKKKEEKEKMSFFERRRHTFNPESGITHQIFINVTEHQRVTENTEKGTRILVARYPDFYKIYLFQYMLPGTEGYPRGGVRAWNVNEEQMQCFYVESVALHPDGGKHRFFQGLDENE
jgi:hypothetical protein